MARAWMNLDWFYSYVPSNPSSFRSFRKFYSFSRVLRGSENVNQWTHKSPKCQVITAMLPLLTDSFHLYLHHGSDWNSVNLVRDTVLVVIGGDDDDDDDKDHAADDNCDSAWRWWWWWWGGGGEGGDASKSDHVVPTFSYDEIGVTDTQGRAIC